MQDERWQPIRSDGEHMRVYAVVVNGADVTFRREYVSGYYAGAHTYRPSIHSQMRIEHAIRKMTIHSIGNDGVCFMRQNSQTTT